MIREIFYAPGDVVAGKLTTRQRRAIATWLLIWITVTIPVRYIWKDAVWMVWLISEVALVLALLGVMSAETPVEKEDEIMDDRVTR